ncbi:MAG: aminoglycoside phosphotransferase family protein [Chloroflexota bacterium]
MTVKANFPPTFIKRVHTIFGDAGQAWLPTLPALIARCREKWSLAESEICPTLRMNYIEFAITAEGVPVALKIGVPHKELFTEITTLKLYDGNAAVRLLDADLTLGAMLLQRLQPGTMLYQLSDNEAETQIAAKIMKKLLLAPPHAHNLPKFSQWVDRAFHLTRTSWDPQGEKMPAHLVNRAEQAFRKIEQSVQPEVVLHGDLHHENILFDDKRGWLAIDPKGVVGPACLEVGRFLQNQLSSDDPLEHRADIVQRRIDIFSSELAYDPQVIIASGFVDCVLSLCWGFEETELSSDWFQGLELAHWFSDSLKLERL